MGAVIMINSNEGYLLINEIMSAIAIEYTWPDYISSVPELVSIEKKEIERYAGIYSLDENEFEIVIANDAISLKYQNQDPVQLSQTTNGEFRNDQLNFSLTFKEDELHLTQKGNTTIYKKKSSK